MVEDDPAALNGAGATCGITMTTGHNYGELFISFVYLVEFSISSCAYHMLKTISNLSSYETISIKQTIH